MGSIGTPQLIIVLIIVLLLFGAKRLPEAARGVGRSLKIFKSETQGLISDDKPSDVTGESDTAAPQPQQPPRAVEPTTPQQPASEAVNDQTRRDA